jgi:hypothetical protein
MVLFSSEMSTFINPLPEQTPHRGIVQVKVDISLKNKTIYGVPFRHSIYMNYLFRERVKKSSMAGFFQVNS